MGAERNLEAVRKWLNPGGEFVRSETETHELMQELWDAEASYHPSRKFPGAMSTLGREAIMAWYQQSFEGVESWSFELVSLEPLPPERVLAHTRVRAKGRASGVELDAEMFHCVWLREGRFFRMEVHMTERGARRALGLDE